MAPGIFLGDPECLKRASEPADGEEIRFRAYQGYAGWGPGQLDSELAHSAWLTAIPDPDLVFGTPADEIALNTFLTNSDKTPDLGWVYTVIAGVLNILVIYDAFAGPAFGTGAQPAVEVPRPTQEVART